MLVKWPRVLKTSISSACTINQTCIVHYDGYVENSQLREGGVRNRDCKSEIEKCKGKSYKCREQKNDCRSGVEKQMFSSNIRRFNDFLRRF